LSIHLLLLIVGFPAAWLVVTALVVAACRAAARSDGRDLPDA
jgi:hypothetical protein